MQADCGPQRDPEGSAPAGEAAPSGETGELIQMTPPNPRPQDAFAAPGQIPEFDAAIRRNAASFAQLGVATFYSRRENSEDPYTRATYLSYIEPLSAAFEAAHGGIIYSYYCQDLIAAAVLTDRKELFVIPPPVSPNSIPIAELLSECDRINVEADRVLSGAERALDLQTIKRLIYELIVKLLSLSEQIVRQNSLPHGILGLYQNESKHAFDYYIRAATRFAQFDYFCGMVIGSSGVTVVTIIIGLCLWVSLGLGGNIGTLVGSLAAGAIGAVISVMSRMTFGRLSLDYEAGRKLVTMLGAFRPILGMGFGAAMWILTGSGLLGTIPTDASKHNYFRVLLAFLAGFSERFAQDMLGSTANRVSSHSLG